MFNKCSGGCNDMFMILMLLCCCGGGSQGCSNDCAHDMSDCCRDDRKCCECDHKKGGCDCCDLLVWIMLINCMCGGKMCR